MGIDLGVKCIRHCSKCYKSKFKNVEATGSRIKFQAVLIDREKPSIDRDAICKILNKAR